MWKLPLLLLMVLQGPDYRRGVALLEQGKPAEAAAVLESAAKAEPKQAQVWKALGVAYAMQGDHMAASEPFSKACAIDPGLPDACYYYGRNLYALNRFELAVSPLRRSLVTDAAKARAEAALGECYEALGSSAEAEKMFRRAIARADSSVEGALLAYSRFLIRSGRPTESIPLLGAVIEGNASSGEAHYQMARALQQLDRLNQAVLHAERAVALEPQRVAARAQLARIYRRLGRDADATREEQATLSLQGSTTTKD